MSEQRNTTTMLIVFDNSGRVVSAMPLGDSSDQKIKIGIVPLPGQRVCKAQVPSVIAGLSGPDLHAVLDRVTFEQKSEKVNLRPLKIEHVSERKSKSQK